MLFELLPPFHLHSLAWRCLPDTPLYGINMTYLRAKQNTPSIYNALSLLAYSLCLFTAKFLMTLAKALLFYLPFTLKYFSFWLLYSLLYLDGFLAKALIAKSMELFLFYILFYFLATFGATGFSLCVEKKSFLLSFSFFFLSCAFFSHLGTLSQSALEASPTLTTLQTMFLSWGPFHCFSAFILILNSLPAQFHSKTLVIILKTPKFKFLLDGASELQYLLTSCLLDLSIQW